MRAALLALSLALSVALFPEDSSAESAIPLPALVEVPTFTPGLPWQEDAQVIKVSQLLSDRAPQLSDWNEAARVIVNESRKAHLDPLFVLAVIEVESRFQTEALSSAGAEGLMQVLPGTFKLVMGHSRQKGDHLEDIRAGVRYLGSMKQLFGKEDLFLIAYNAGPGTVMSYQDVEIPERFFEYPHEVHTRYSRFKHLLASR